MGTFTQVLVIVLMLARKSRKAPKGGGTLAESLHGEIVQVWEIK